jgi:hypothetical protein
MKTKVICQDEVLDDELDDEPELNIWGEPVEEDYCDYTEICPDDDDEPITNIWGEPITEWP